MAIDRILKDKRDEIIRTANRHGARTVHIFGSRARGEANPGSDLDLLVTLDEHASLLDIVAIKQDLEDLLGCKVDVLTEDAISPYIRDHVLKQAIPL